MTLHILSKQDTVLNKFIAQIRDKSVQKDSMRFRRNLERIGEITAYEISKELAYSPRVVETPLGEAEVGLIDDQVVVATILRAGLPYHQGFLNYFDDAENAFVSAYRKSTKDGKFTVKVEYISCGDLEGKVLLLVDPMLATGSSLVLAYKALCEKGGTPKYTHVAAVIASEQGIDYVQKNMPPPRSGRPPSTRSGPRAAISSRVSAMPVTWPTARRSDPGIPVPDSSGTDLSRKIPVSGVPPTSSPAVGGGEPGVDRQTNLCSVWRRSRCRFLAVEKSDPLLPVAVCSERMCPAGAGFRRVPAL